MPELVFAHFLNALAAILEPGAAVCFCFSKSDPGKLEIVLVPHSFS